MARCLRCGKKSIGQYCFHHKPRTAMRQHRPLRRESPKTRQRREQTAREWHRKNPPDEDGYWRCYLRISPRCYIQVNIETLNREHMESKARQPGRKFDITNIKPACSPCNELKGSRSYKEFL